MGPRKSLGPIQSADVALLPLSHIPNRVRKPLGTPLYAANRSPTGQSAGTGPAANRGQYPRHGQQPRIAPQPEQPREVVSHPLSPHQFRCRLPHHDVNERRLRIRMFGRERAHDIVDDIAQVLVLRKTWHHRPPLSSHQTVATIVLSQPPVTPLGAARGYLRSTASSAARHG